MRTRKGTTPHRSTSGRASAWWITSLARCLHFSQAQAVTAVLKSDGEASSKSIQERFRIARSAPTIAPKSPIGHESNEEVSRRGLDRCLGITIWVATAVQLGPSHPILAWAVRHAVWLFTRFQVKSSGEKAHYSRCGRKYSGEIGLGRGDGVLQVRWVRQAVFARDRASTLSAIERGARAARTICKHAATTSDGWLELVRARSRR